MASLRYNRRHICGGSIINECTVLTAAHCVSEINRLQLSIRVGSSRNDKGGYTVQVREIIFHENFWVPPARNQARDDLALLRLASRLSFIKSRAPGPVALFKKMERLEPGTMVKIAGWGYLGENTLVKYLQSVEVPMFATELCNYSYNLYGQGIFKGQICTWYEGGRKDACNGDSGGPLTLGNKQLGIVSYGSACASDLLPTVYTEIAYHRDWIDRHSMVSSGKSPGYCVRTIEYLHLVFLFLYFLL